jgi:hypothetical protein
MSLVFASLVLWSKASEAAETEKIPLSFSFKFMGARRQTDTCTPGILKQQQY